MPRPKDEERTKARKREILEAASRCFVRHGFHRASMRQICKEAGLSAGAVYNYFPSKDAIIEGFAEWEQEEIGELAAYLKSEKNAFRGVIEAAKAIVEDSTADDARLYAELAAEAGRNEAVRNRFEASDAALKACLLDAIRRGQADGKITKKQKAEDLLTLVTVTYEGFVGHLATEPNADKKRLTKLTEYALKKLLTP